MKKLFAIAAVAFTAALSQPASAIVLLDEDFSGETATVLNYNSFANWDVFNGTVDTIGGSFGGVSCVGGAGVCVDLDGSTSDAGELTSKTAFTLNAGETITLMFTYSGNQRSGFDSMTVSLGSFYSETFSGIPANQGYQTVTRSFSAGAGGTAKLVFADAGSDNVGIMLDSVKLENDTKTGVIPVPAPIAMMATVVGLAAWRARRVG